MLSDKSFQTVLLSTVVAVALLALDATIEIFSTDRPAVAVTHTLYLLALAIPISGLIYLSRRLPQIWMLLANSLLLTFGILSLKLNFHQEVLELPFIQYASLATVVGVFALGFIAALASESPNLRRAVLIAAVLTLLSPLPLRLFVKDSKNETLPREDASGLASISFAERPNIYLLSIDSLIPNDVARDNLGVDDLPYYRLLGIDLKEVPMTLSFQVPSAASLNSVMRLSQSSQSSRIDYFTGRSESLLSQIAKQNGYRLITGWPGFVPDWRRGSAVDDMIQPVLSATPDTSFLCSDHLSRKIFIRSFFYCSFFHDAASLSEKEPYRDTVLRFLSEEKTFSDPFIVFTYVYFPIGHTSLTYNHSSKKERQEYRNFFSTGANGAANFLNSALNAIRKNDPNAIVLVFGDHGAYLSRSSDPSDDPEFFYRDRHRIFFASMIGGHRCNSPKRVYSAGRYNTPSRFLVDVLMCLQSGAGAIKPSFEEDQEVLRYVVDR
jgi:hypothetical protein